MDRNFHTDDFERLLREKSNEFRMYPSKRIWHSVYNNIHPGRKWPSVAMSILLITALFLVGYLNTKNTNSYAASQKNLPDQKIVSQARSPQSVSKNMFDYTAVSSHLTANTISSPKQEITTGLNYNNGITSSSNKKQAALLSSTPLTPKEAVAENARFHTDIISEENKLTTFSLNSTSVAVDAGDLKTPTTGEHDQLAPENPQSGVLALASLEKTSIHNLETLPVKNDLLTSYNNKQPSVTVPALALATSTNNIPATKKDNISAEDKEWIENYALYNRPAAKKWIGKLAWQIYATPSVVYRSLYIDQNFGNTITTPLPISSLNEDINKAVNQKPSIGFEIGTGLLYQVVKGVKLKAGIQLNYTRYTAEAYQNTHPVATKLTMHDYETGMAYEVYRTTPYSNKNGLEFTKLHNETFQLSLPIGADLKLWGNDYLQWNVGVTVQPTYVPFGKSYLISSDKRNYIKETSMINRWNVNAGVETFISYKADNGLTYQIGPQFRTQLFSTNIKQIAVQEKLLNYGLKFGISKNF